MSENEVIDQNASDATEGAEGGAVDLKETLKSVIKVKVADAGVLRKTLTVTVPRESLQTEFDKEYKELLTEATVPGFRKGRAPRRLIEKRFGRDVNDQVQTRILSNAYLAAVEREDMKVLGDPLVWVRAKDKSGEEKEQLADMQAALSSIRIPDDGDFEFRCEVEVKPEFELPNLEKVPVSKPSLEISDDDVSVQIDRLRARRGSFAPTAEGDVVQADDLLVCDMRMTVDGAEIKTAENVRFAARAQMLEGAVVSDFGQKMAGAKVGESRTVEGPLPDDYATADLRGKTAKFELKVQEIKRLQLPPLDASFLESMGFDKESDFREYVRTTMQSQLGEEIRRGMQEQVRRYLLENTKIEVPEGLSSRQAERIASRRRVELARQGVPDDEIEKHADEMMTGARAQAATELKLFFILDKIAEKWKIDVTEEELNSQIASIARSYNRRFDRVRDELTQNNGLTMLYLEIRDEKCIDRILESAEITDAKLGEAKGEASDTESTKSGAAKGTSKKTATRSQAPAAKATDKGAEDAGVEAKAPKGRKKAADSAATAEEPAKAAKKTTRKKSE
ncbi:MAG: trigger factor [Phycisphaerae bacterium]|nr:trigger factor [Phycisphaerae bacterium]